jgi:hypothetical protein
VSLLQSDREYDYEDFVKDFLPVYKTLGRDDWEEMQRDFGRTLFGTDQTVAAFRGEAMIADGASAEGRWIRYRSATTSRQVFPKLGKWTIRNIMDRGPSRDIAPYDYLPEALERARKNIAAPAGGASGAGAGGGEGE